MKGKIKMKKNIFNLLIIMVLISGCSTPYQAAKGIKSFNELQYKYPVNKVHLPQSGYDIAYTDMGSGDKTVIMIHGLGSYLRAWERNMEEVSKTARVIAIDLPGYGKSSKEPHDGAMIFYAEIIKEFVKQLELKNIVIVGHSMGGQIAMTTALQYPDMVKGLILVDPAGFERFTKGQKQWFRDVMTFDGVRLTTADAIQNNLVTNFYRMPKDADFMITDRLAMRSAEDFSAYCYAVVQSVNGMVDYPVIDYLQDIKIPTLIFFGENDNLIPNRFLNPGFTKNIAQYGASKIKNSKLIMVPKTGHFMMFEKPQVFNSETTAFLKSMK
ncbi:Alpha/beta hydrolase fold containing protein [uncultured Paludibacter sp.]|nr:Alpha/beta hydrolase fold containing protein [uncultured Paludibacter sp.]